MKIPDAHYAQKTIKELCNSYIVLNLKKPLAFSPFPYYIVGVKKNKIQYNINKVVLMKGGS